MIRWFLNWITSQAPMLSIAYRIGAWEEFNRCQNHHQKIIDEIQKFYVKKLGPRKFIELQKLYAKSKNS
jgi:hypothetical protein